MNTEFKNAKTVDIFHMENLFRNDNKLGMVMFRNVKTETMKAGKKVGRTI